MAIQTTPHTRDHDEPARADFDEKELSGEGGKGYDGAEVTELREAQTAGSRNERVTSHSGNEHHVEPTTASQYPTGTASAQPSPAASGITNHLFTEEKEQQDRVPDTQPERDAATDPADL